LQLDHVNDLKMMIQRLIDLPELNLQGESESEGQDDAFFKDKST